MTMNQDAIAQRLREARRAAGYDNPTDAARAMGVSTPTYLGHENGSRGISRVSARYAQFFRARLDWLLTGKGPMKETMREQGSPVLPPPEYEDLPQHDAARTTGFGEGEIAPREMPRSLPVFGSASCGDDGLFEFNVGEPSDHIRRPPRLAGVKDAYALYVASESMSPWREHGQLVYVHPHQPVRIDDYVVVQMKPARVQDGEMPAAYIKRLIRRNSEAITLLQYNPRREITVRLSRVKSLHRILDWSELMGI